jgi:putative oxidoreductase
MRKALSSLFVAAGFLQLSGIRPVRRAYARWGYPEWFRVAIGAIELEAGLLAAFDTTQRLASLQLMPIMAGSIYTHGKTPGERRMIVVPLLTVLALFRLAQSRRGS